VVFKGGPSGLQIYRQLRSKQKACGTGKATSQDTPVEVDPSQLTSIVAVTADEDSSYAPSSDGSLWVSGDDGHLSEAV
jgi:hypothetical protein